MSALSCREQNPILGTRSEHTVRLIHPFGHQVVDQYPDVGFVACQYERLLPYHCRDAH